MPCGPSHRPVALLASGVRLLASGVRLLVGEVALLVSGVAGRAGLVAPRRGALVDVALGAPGHDVGHRRALALAPLGLAALELGITALELGLTGVQALVARGELALTATQVLVAQAGLPELALVVAACRLGALLGLGETGGLLVLSAHPDATTAAAEASAQPSAKRSTATAP